MEIKQDFTTIPMKYDPEDTEHFCTRVEQWPGCEPIEVIYRKGNGTLTYEQMQAAIQAGQQVPPFAFCPELNTHTYEPRPGILCDRDTPMQLRDGTTIYADIYRPANTTEKVPCIVAWGPFGKNPGESPAQFQLVGVPPKTVSEMAKFEAADPGFWVPNGYAVANVNPRGIGNSEGWVSNWGVQDHYDGYDFIEWVAEQPWCNGKVTIFGNSGVCMVIWGIAATNPPHLACIGAWEGTGDMYRESFCMGGIMGPFYNDNMVNTMACKTWVEDCPNMLAAHPYFDEYWQARAPKWSKIRVPAYICSGLCHIHNRGSWEAFRKIRSPKKWFRAHRNMEWPDTYNRDNLDDLKKFFDRYCKEINNGWETTPRVRLDIMDAYDYDYQPARVENEIPLARTQYKKLYLDAYSHSLSYEPFDSPAEVSYNPATETTCFDITFTEDTEITGYISAHLNIECRGHDDMDMFLWVKKLGERGDYVPVYCAGKPYRGAWAYFRGQRRELDPKLSTDYDPVQAHQKDEPMEQGVIYPVDIEFYPTCRIWHAGETLRLEVQGRFIETDWFEDSHFLFESDNGDGIHVLHTGAEHQSWLQIPYIPPKYKAGNYVYR